MVQIVGKDGQPEPRRVRIGINNGASAQVLEGLQESDRVVVGEGGGAPSQNSRNSAARMGAPMMGPRR
jgi:macrolide-specific efflux system membrane fusion protein